MATYRDALLGEQPSVSNGKDFITNFAGIGTLDVYQETLVGGVDYTISAFGASNGGTLPDPAVLVFDSFGQLIDGQLDSFVLGGRDPFFNFRTPGLGVGQTSTYYVAVFDQTQSGGQYTLAVEGAGPPISFGGPLGTTFL